MYACATEDFSVHFLTIVADFTTSVETVDAVDWSAYDFISDKNTIVSSCDDAFVFDDDWTNSLFETTGTLFEDIADGEKIVVEVWSIGRDNLLVVFWLFN